MARNTHAEVDLQVASDLPSQVTESLQERRMANSGLWIVSGHSVEHADAPHPFALLRARCERPRNRRTAESGYQFPPSDGDCHTPLPCEVRKGNDTTSRACSLAVQGGRMLVAFTSFVGILPPPTFGERGHGGLARSLITVGWRALLVVAEGKRPHPRHPHRYSGRLHDAPNHDAIAEHVEVIVAPLAGGTEN